jgi:hypothetical protein
MSAAPPSTTKTLIVSDVCHHYIKHGHVNFFLTLSLQLFMFPIGKVKVKVSPCSTNEALRQEDVWGSGCIYPHFLYLGTSWRWVVTFTPLSLYSRERATGTHFIGGWVDPRAGLDDMEKWKFFTLPGFELPTPLVVQPVASRYTVWAIQFGSFSNTCCFTQVWHLVSNSTE